MILPLLEERGWSYTMIEPHEKEHIPPTDAYDGMIVLGGPCSANDDDFSMRMQLERTKEILEAKKAFLGICLGLQTAVKVMGGRVYPNHTREIGFRDEAGDLFTIELTEEGKKDPLFEGLESTLPLMHLHGETVEITNEMTLLATGKHCTNQVVKIAPRAYGIQGHFELNDEMFERCCKEDSDLQTIDIEGARRDYELLKKEYHYAAIGNRFINNFLDLI